MKLVLNRKELKLILICFGICFAINTLYFDQNAILGLAETFVIATPYIITVIISLVYNFNQKGYIYINTHKGFIVVMLVLEFLLFKGKLSYVPDPNSIEGQKKQLEIKMKQLEIDGQRIDSILEPINSTRKELSKTNLTDYKFEICSFKKFLKDKNIDMNIDVPNQYETVQPHNKYSNHYFNVTTDFPDNWEHDRGISEYAIFRAYNLDSAISLSLIAMPINCEKNASEESYKNFQNAPLKTFNNAYGGNYKNYLKKQLSLSTNVKVEQLEIREKRVRTTNFLITFYTYNETNEEGEVRFISTSYQTVFWGVIYTFNYTVPFAFYNTNLFTTILAQTNFINPQL